MLRTYHLLVRMAVVAAVSMAMQCCTLIYEWPDDSGAESSANLRISISVPSTKAPIGDEAPGYSYDDPNLHEGSDNTLMLSDLDFYFFNLDGSYVTHASGFGNVSLSSDAYSDRLHRYTADIKVDKVVNNREYRVVAVANRMQNQYGYTSFSVPATPDPHSPDSRTDEEFLYSQLVFDTCRPSEQLNYHLSDYTSWNLSGYDYARVPMWGVQKMSLKIRVGEEGTLDPSGEIYLLRSIAKVKVSLGEDLSRYVKIADHVSGDAETGAVLSYSRAYGYMTPSYANVLSCADASDINTWNSAGKDWNGTKYVDVNVNTLGEAGTFKAPMFKDADGSCYTYLPEQNIGEAFMSLQFLYTDKMLSEPLEIHKTIQFADYVKASAATGKIDIPLTDEELAPYRFPVMRNHYYIYTVTKLDPFELKFEVCPWMYRSTNIDFGYVPSRIEEILGFTGYAFRYTRSGSELRFWVKGSVTNPNATITDVYVDGNKAVLESDEYATGLCYWKERNTIDVRYTVRFGGVDYVIVRTETIS